MTHRTHTATGQLWEDRIDRFNLSGLSVAQFCSQEGFSQASLYQWRRKLRSDPSPKQALATFVPVKLSGGELREEPKPPSLPKPLPKPPSLPTTVMSVELPGGVRVHLEVTNTEGVQP